VSIPQKKGDPVVVDRDEHPRETSLEALAKLKGVVRPDGTVTAGNASGVNDGACALLLASEARRRAPRPDAARPRGGHGHRGRGAAHHGLRPGAGHAQGAGADRPDLAQMDVIELNEAFAAQGLAVLRDLGLADDDPRVNPGAAPLRWATRWAPAAHGWSPPPSTSCTGGGRYALCTMCIGVGQGIVVSSGSEQSRRAAAFPAGRCGR
jgi:acetyl-CoA acetyltransferase